jgi:hypothetical protein
MAGATPNISEFVSLADVGEYRKQRDGGSEGAALHAVDAAFRAGCPLLLQVFRRGRLVAEWRITRWRRCRLEWNHPFIRVGLRVPQPPRVLRIALKLFGRRDGELQAYLPRKDAERFGLLPPSETLRAEPQAAQPEPPSAPPPKRKKKRKKAKPKEVVPPSAPSAPQADKPQSTEGWVDAKIKQLKKMASSFGQRRGQRRPSLRSLAESAQIEMSEDARVGKVVRALTRKRIQNIFYEDKELKMLYR